jgi:hypothetical protein
VIETLLGGLLGGAFRLTPEILKWIDRKGERSHELAIHDKNLELEKLRASTAMKQVEVKAESAQQAKAINTLNSAVTSQGIVTGVKWADALSSSVRPIITYWLMVLYCAAKTAVFVAAVQNGVEWTTATQHSWTEADQALWAGVLNFWFLGRVFEKNSTRVSNYTM